jgi:hypothetical protein
MVSQLILYERDNVKCSPTFNRPKNLDNNNFNKFNVLQKLVVNDDAKKIAPKLVKGLSSFSSCKIVSKLCTWS